MRLIDGDALMRTHENEVAAIGNDWTVEDLAAAIETAPTVKAVPIAWLEERRDDMEDAEQDFPAQAIRYVLWLWEKHKEA